MKSIKSRLEVVPPIAAMTATLICSPAFGHAGPRIYLNIQNGQVVTYEGPYPEPEDSNGNVSTNPADYNNYAPSLVFPGLPPDETGQNGQPTAGVLPLSWDDEPSNFTTEFPGLQTYGPGSVASGTSFSFNIAGEVQFFNTTNASFESISQAFPTNTPSIAVNNDLGQLAFSGTGFVPGYLAFTYDGDPTDHEHLTFTIVTPDDLADGFSPEDAPAGVYALPLQLTSTAANTPSDTFYILLGDRGPNLSISQTDMENEMLQAIVVANSTLAAPGESLVWNNATGSGDGHTWDVSTNQNWTNNGATSAFADGDNVTFNDANSGNYAVALNGSVSPGSVIVNNASGNYLIAGMGSITGTGTLLKTGSGTLTIGTANSYTGETLVNGGTLIAAVPGAIPNSKITLTGGTIQLAANTGVTQTPELSITGSGLLDLGNNTLIINYGAAPDPFASIAALLAAGYNGGAWNGASGIDTSAPLVGGGRSYGLGYADSADPGNPANLSSGAIEIKYTLLGDTNLDGAVNSIDFGTLAANFGKSGKVWDQGDFNYDGTINSLDFGFLAGNFGKSLGSAGDTVAAADWAALDAFAKANGLMADVPEPASVAFGAFGACVLLSRRRRRATGGRHHQQQMHARRERRGI
jgi:autotransporter-associated beta strand protein